MIKYIGKNVQAVFPACVQVAVIAGFMLLGTPPCVADGAVTSDVSSESAQINTPTSGHMGNHVDGMKDESMNTGESEKMPKADNVDHKSTKKDVKLPLQGDNYGQPAPKVIRPAAKTFDMDVMIERLKKTDAIGVFTKLALRSDALDLVDMINAYNKHMARYSLKKLRARFDGLLLKVLVLLNDDPGLSRDISLAREEIWKNLLTNKDRSRAAAIYPYSLVQEVKA